MDVLNKNLALNKNLEERVSVVTQPLWSTAGKVLHYIDRGPASNVSSEPIHFDAALNGTCTTTTIDEICDTLDLQKCDFIKMDIEGAELSALKGAEATLRKFRPKLAICLYHSVDDFCDIPKYIHSLGLGYKFYLDHATIHLEETVLFCISDASSELEYMKHKVASLEVKISSKDILLANMKADNDLLKRIVADLYIEKLLQK